MNRLSEKKGFTLAELMIVVAVIGVLAAIAIPIFGTQLSKAKDAAAISALESDYARRMARVMAYEDEDTYTLSEYYEPLREMAGGENYYLQAVASHSYLLHRKDASAPIYSIDLKDLYIEGDTWPIIYSVE